MLAKARYHDPAEDLDDLTQKAFLALVEACQKWDSSSGMKFTSYFTWILKTTLSSGLKNNIVYLKRSPDAPLEIVPYSKFIKLKKHLPPQQNTRSSQEWSQ